uniref:Putative type I polyketide synthase n=1 Tax=Sphaerisporangium sp. SANK 60911 TaxID=1354075 RepID=V5YTB1_9ACTN|nr:putative type I polyketide synthase [Sphaerisporangium sp. SANK 60911]
MPNHSRPTREDPGTDPGSIAVIGVSCRLPHAPDPASFWGLLRDGRSAIDGQPPDGRAPGGDSHERDARASIVPGGYIEGIDRFDAGFFGISPREASAMDPQQRLMLELSWEALEDAGILPAALGGTTTGVFLGSTANDYAILTRRIGPSAISGHTLTGLNRSIIANRVSHTLGLRGPSLTIDTGQSSSLVAAHMACESLRRGESSLALVGGVQLNLDLEGALEVERFGALSPDGRCYTFDHRANGYVRGEGGAVVLLKPLAAALTDGDRVYAVIRGGAINSDGGGDSLAVPHAEAQAEVISAAYAHAGVAPEAVQYVELHGTGTPAGDPVEAAALGTSLGTRRPHGSPVLVGSTKTNVGHLEGAAGIVGLLKVVLSLHHRRVPASLNFEAPNPRIRMDEWNLRVATGLSEWPRPGEPLVAGVSSFGVGGNNCHLVLQENPHAESGETPPAPAGRPVAWTVSGRTRRALRAQAERLRDHLATRQDIDPAEVARALAGTRTAFEYRATVVGDDAPGLLEGLGALAGGDPAAEGVVHDTEPAASAPGGTVFVFPGQGGQWQGMAAELLDGDEAFRAGIEACAEAFAPHVDWHLPDVLRSAPGAPGLERTDVVQPALFAVMVSLAAVWRSLGVRPDAVAGHSQGEIAAAHVAGALTLEDAALVVTRRSRALSTLSGGGMASVSLAASEVTELLARWAGALWVAAANGPESTVVSGDRRAVEEFVAHCESTGVGVRRLSVGYASHGPHVESVREELLDAFAGIRPRRPEIPFYSTVTGTPLGGTSLDAEYWYGNLRRPVRFEETIRALLADGHRAFVEAGPHPLLVTGIEATAERHRPRDTGVTSRSVAVGTLRRGHGGRRQVLLEAARLHAHGTPVDLAATAGSSEPGRSRPLDLPTYPFQRTRHWLGDGGGDDAPDAAPPGAGEDEAGTSELRQRLTGLPVAEQDAVLLDVVRTAVSRVLGHRTTDTVETELSFKALGFDSLTGVELRNRLRATTGLALPGTLVYDHPSPNALARHLRERLLDPARAERAPAAESARPEHEPIAIVAMACRYPGAVDSPEDLWALLEAGKDTASDFPTDRGWDIETLYDPLGERPATTYTRRGGFLTDIDAFDASFFRISPREARAMDPQQRLLLEVSWETLERGRIDPTSLRESLTGVFVGAMSQEYGPRSWEPSDGHDGYLLTGRASSVASGRIAYSLGLRGPAITVDTACSSSLVALHLAAESLRRGDCDLALAGGVTVMATPGLFVEFSRQRGISVDGRCKAFGADADGFGPAEGVGVLLLERLSDARRNGHTVLAVIRGSAVNQDGASNGLTAPNGPAQERVIRQALTNARLNPADIDAIEAHGTGTALGDPIEAQALQTVYGHDPHRTHPIHLGSVKSNIGHTQAAAGVAGVIKIILAMRHHTLPQTLHAHPPTPHIDWTQGHLTLLTTPTPWPPTTHPRRAAISSFGISGTNAHLILEEPEEEQEAETGTTASEAPGGSVEAGQAFAWALSARTPNALRAQAARLLEHVRATPHTDPADVAYSLTNTRALMEERAVVIGRDRDTLIQGLTALADDQPHADLIRGTAQPAPGRIVFVFPGQGTQWPAMAQQLLATNPVFTHHIHTIADALAPHTTWNLLDVLTQKPGAPTLDHVEIVQPALFAVMTALARLWQHHGIHPHAVIGHSQGEIAAAHIAGALTLQDAAKISALRAQTLTTLTHTGAMLSINLPPDQTQTHLTPYKNHLHIAAHNSPTTTIIAGNPQALTHLTNHLKQQGIHHRHLPVTYASHTPHITPLKHQILTTLNDITPQQATIPFYSTLTTTHITDTTTLTPHYWYKNLRHPVQFEPTIRTLLDHGHHTYIETSPHPTLTTHIQTTAEHHTPHTPTHTTPTLKRHHGDHHQLLHAIATLHTHGISATWPTPPDARAVDLPAYAFERERHWLAATPSVSAPGVTALDHPLLSAAMELPQDDGLVLTGVISLETHPWLADHTVLGTTLLPGTAFVELALEAARHVGVDHLDELTLHTALVLAGNGPVLLQVTVGAPDDAGRRPVAIHSRSHTPGQESADNPWTAHATGFAGVDTAETQVPDAAPWPPQEAVPIPLGDVYEDLARLGYEYGPAFQGLLRAWRHGREVLAEVALPPGVHGDVARFGVHPALLDAALHPLLVSGDQLVSDASQPLLPFTWSGVGVHGTGATAARVRLTLGESGSASVRVESQSGAPLLTGAELTFRPLPAAAGDAQAASPYVVTWEPWSPTDANLPGLAVLASGDRGTTEALGRVLAAEERYADLAALRTAVADGAPVPGLVFAAAPDAAETAEGLLDVTSQALSLVQEWLADDRWADSRLVVVTQGAVRANDDTVVSRPGHAAVRGLLRSAQSENPGRIVLLDLEPEGAPPRAEEPENLVSLLTAAASGSEPQLAVRRGALLVARLTPPPARNAGPRPDGAGAWRLEASRSGGTDDLTLDSLTAARNPSAERPLEAGEVRVEVRASGVNFRDVLIALGMYPDEARIGSEAAGVVREVGSGVTEFAPGDRVTGLFPGRYEGAIANVAITDRRYLTRYPAEWTFAQAASVPAAFLTAWYALVDLADVQAGESVLVHAATGGVGQATLQLARHLGLEPYATAAPHKWSVLRSLGLDDAHIGSSRSLEFEERFRETARGRGVDVVVNSLTREYIDASLRLLRDGGRFVEMGKLDLRDPASLGTIRYRSFDLIDAGPDHIHDMFGRLMPLFESGALAPLPLRAWDLHEVHDAFRHMREARHIGKVVISIRPAPDPDGTVLITGGTGSLGGLVARHLVTRHGVRHLRLLSRRGPDAAGELVAELTALGATVTVAACDVTDRQSLAAQLAAIPPGHPLTAVVHAAGVLDDGIVTELTPERLDRVLRPKATAAFHLLDLTRHLDLAAFVMFSSAAGVFGNAGQANYAAANAYLDAQARRHRAMGLPVTSLAWGLWEEVSGMTGHLDGTDLARLARLGILPLPTEEALRLFDEAGLEAGPAVSVPVRLDRTALRRTDPAGLPALLSGLGGPPRRSRAGRARVAATDHRQEAPGRADLSRWTRDDPKAGILDLVRAQIAAVIGSAPGTAIPTDRTFKELGFDSLTSVELRNRLNSVTGLRLPAGLIFDHPTPAALAAKLATDLLGAEQDATSPEGPRPQASAEDEIAIIAMACRFPGGVRTPEELWSLLQDNRDAIAEIPHDRGWDLSSWFGSESGPEGTVGGLRGGFLYDAADFDPGVFRISPKEALAMDPQQRILLELTWEAFERAGLRPSSLRGSATGLFAGIIYNDYGSRFLENVPSGLEGYIGNGSAGSVGSGRVAYTFGLEGPAVTIDTACSSSLVAAHLAVQSLRSGETSLALAGGITVMATPAPFAEFSRQRGLAADGRCKAFGAAADGTGLSEGGGLLLLERLSDARRNGHPVLAVIRGSAMNQDGSSNGLTAPNGSAQQRVIRQALANARLEPGDVDAVEAHGTGTALGDPIEAQAILATYGQRGPEDRPVILGSLKSNIGHTQAAAGVAGVIKMVQAMRHGMVPRTLHVEEPTPMVDWDTGAVRLAARNTPWPEGDRPRRAGVSSFGISGTNVHLILELPGSADPVPSPQADEPAEPGLVTWPLSGATPEALRAQAAVLERYAAGAAPDVRETASWLLTREAFARRAVVLAEDGDGFAEALRALAAGRPDPRVVTGGVHDPAAVPRTAFMFAGQGTQRPGLGAELYRAYPVFAEALDEVCAALDPHLDRPLRDVMFAVDGPSLLDATRYTQPALFAYEVALYRLVTRYTGPPDHLLGHSLGEVIAAHVAGVLDLPDAAALVAARGRLMGELPPGAMVSIACTPDELEHLLTGDVTIAAYNTATSTVISGDPAAVEAIAASFRERGRKVRTLSSRHAFHSSHTEAIADRFHEAIASLSFHAPAIPVVSNLTGQVATAEELTDPRYWVEQIRRPVRFHEAVTTLDGQSVGAYLEIGPDDTLTSLARPAVDTAVVVPAQSGDGPAPHALMTALSHLHAHGVPIGWPSAARGHTPPDGLPTYAFQRERYWLDATPSVAAPGISSLDHPLLSAATELPDGGLLLSGVVSLKTHPWLADHTILGTTLLPGTAFVELALEAARHAGGEVLDELTLHTPLTLADPVLVQVTVGAPDAAGRRPVSVHSRSQASDRESQESPWTAHATGTIGLAMSPGARGETGLGGVWPPEGAAPVDIEGLYARAEDLGVRYGPAFRAITSAWLAEGRAYAEVRLPEGQREDVLRYRVHPVLLDAALQLLSATGLAPGAEDDDRVVLPFTWTAVTVHAPSTGTVRVGLAPLPDGDLALSIASPGGEPIAVVGAVAVRPVPITGIVPPVARRTAGSLFTTVWVEPENTHTPDISDGTQVLVALGEPVAGADVVADLSAMWASISEGAPLPDAVMDPSPLSFTIGADDPESAASADEVTARVLRLLQDWLKDERLTDSQLVVLTRNGVAVEGDAPINPAHAAVWGLVRSAQQEHPDRFVLLDLDEHPLTEQALHHVLTGGESQFALRGERLLVPRLTRLDTPQPQPAPRPLNPEGTILITGGTGTLGAATARHLITHHGARHLLLTSRQGPNAPHAQQLHNELTDLGAHITIKAADATDPHTLTQLLADLPPDHPLTAVIHTAGALADATLTHLTDQHLATTMHPKAHAAHTLHTHTQNHPLTHFILYSSLAGTLGSPGQANYAAANAYLDALAHHRHHHNQPATSIAWGLWAQPSTMTAHLTPADHQRLHHHGITPLTTQHALHLLDQALATSEPVVAAADLNPPPTVTDPVLGRLTRATTGRPSTPARPEPAYLADRLTSLPSEERRTVLHDIVRSEIAMALGYTASTIDDHRRFLDMGIDSLSAVQIRNRLTTATGLRLTTTLLFDHPTPHALTEHLLASLPVDEARSPANSVRRVLDELDRLATALGDTPKTDPSRRALTEGMREILARVMAGEAARAGEPEHADISGRIATASDEEIFGLLDDLDI